MNLKLLCGIATVCASLLVASCSNPISSGDAKDDILKSAGTISYSVTIKPGKTNSRTFALNGDTKLTYSYYSSANPPVPMKKDKATKILTYATYDKNGKKLASISKTATWTSHTANDYWKRGSSNDRYDLTEPMNNHDRSGNWKFVMKNHTTSDITVDMKISTSK